MSTLSGSSTDTQVRTAVDDNASYEEDQSVSKCRAYITAVRIWLRRLSERKSVSDSDSRIDREIEAMRKDLEEARAWLLENDGGTDEQGAQVSYADFGDYRD